MELKICGLSKILEVETCVAYNVNYCGFILNYPKSHRYISFEQARALTNIHREDTKYVGVLVKPSEKELETFSQLNFDYFQLYGNYSDAKIFVDGNIKSMVTPISETFQVLIWHLLVSHPKLQKNSTTW